MADGMMTSTGATADTRPVGVESPPEAPPEDLRGGLTNWFLVVTTDKYGRTVFSWGSGIGYDDGSALLAMLGLSSIDDLPAFIENASPEQLAQLEAYRDAVTSVDNWNDLSNEEKNAALEEAGLSGFFPAEETEVTAPADDRTDWQKNKDYIIEQIESGNASQSMQDWYDRWVFSGKPDTQGGMVSEEAYKDATVPEENIVYQPPEDPNKEITEYPGGGGGGAEEQATDSDGDGVPDDEDWNPNDPNISTEDEYNEEVAKREQEIAECVQNGDFECAEQKAKDATEQGIFTGDIQGEAEKDVQVSEEAWKEREQSAEQSEKDVEESGVVVDGDPANYEILEPTSDGCYMVRNKTTGNVFKACPADIEDGEPYDDEQDEEDINEDTTKDGEEGLNALEQLAKDFEPIDDPEQQLGFGPSSVTKDEEPKPDGEADGTAGDKDGEADGTVGDKDGEEGLNALEQLVKDFEPIDDPEQQLGFGHSIVTKDGNGAENGDNKDSDDNGDGDDDGDGDDNGDGDGAGMMASRPASASSFTPFMAGISYTAPTIQGLVQSPQVDYVAALNNIINRGMLT